MPDFSTTDNRCLDSWHSLISCQFKHRYPLNISCSKIFDSCKIKRMVTNLTQLWYVNNYDKNRFQKFFRKQLYIQNRYVSNTAMISPLLFAFSVLLEIEVYIFALLGKPVKVLPAGKCCIFTV